MKQKYMTNTYECIIFTIFAANLSTFYPNNNKQLKNRYE